MICSYSGEEEKITDGNIHFESLVERIIEINIFYSLIIAREQATLHPCITIEARTLSVYLFVSHTTKTLTKKHVL